MISIAKSYRGRERKMGAGGEALGKFFGLRLSSVWKMPFVDRDGTTKRALCSFTEKSIQPGPLP